MTTPRTGDTITAVEKLEALPVGSVVLDSMDDAGIIDSGLMGPIVQFAETVPIGITKAAKSYGPFTVLYVPGEQARPSVTDNARAEAWDEGYLAGHECALPTEKVKTWNFHSCRIENPYRAAGRVETTTSVIHLSNPDDGASFCDQPVTIITEAGDTRPVCQTCHRGAMKYAHRRAETTTEWGVRGQSSGIVTLQRSEQRARTMANSLGSFTPVRREVTQWTEVQP